MRSSLKEIAMQLGIIGFGGRKCHDYILVGKVYSTATIATNYLDDSSGSFYGSAADCREYNDYDESQSDSDVLQRLTKHGYQKVCPDYQSVLNQ